MVKEWSQVKIGDILDFKNGLNKGKEFFGSGTPIVNYTDVYHKCGLKVDDVKGTVTLTSDELRRFEAKKNDVFFTRTSETPEEVGISSVLLDDIVNCVFSGFILRGRPKNDSLEPRYCKYCFSTKQIRIEIIRNCTYTTRALTNGKVLSVIEMPLPDKGEQAAIATTIECFDTYIGNLTELIEKKRNIRDGALEDLIGGKTRITGYKECLIEKTLGKISSIQDGTHGTFKRTNSGFYLLSAKNVFNNHLVLGEDESKVSEQDYLKIVSNGYPQKGDILLSCVGTIGRCCLLEKDGVAFQRSVAFIRVKDINKQYLLYVLQSNEIQNQLLSMVNASAQGGIYLGALNKIKLRITMNEKEQETIASILMAMDEEIEALENERDKIIQIREGAMDELLTGRVRLKV